jgi:multisubunit Na+/H+ antiporter MnhG subunit
LKALLEEIKKIKTDSKELRKFGIILAIVLGLLGGFALYKGSGKYLGFWGVGLLFLVFGLFLPQFLKSVYKAWMALALVLGWINTHLILGLIFYLVFTPMGLIMKLLGKDLLDQKLDPEAKTYWKKREKSSLGIRRYERLF